MMITTQQKAIQDLIELANHNPKWSSKAKTEIAHIKSTLGNDFIIDIQHIGSTAIPNIKSKPIIDIMIGVTSFDNMEKKLIKPLEAIGYLFWKNNPDKERLFFVKGLPPLGKKRTHHIHITKHNSATWDQHIFFRNYLTKHPSTAKAYETLKITLASKYQQDRESYTQKKESFIKQVLHNAHLITSL